MRGQGPGDTHSLLLASAELARFALGSRLEPHLVQGSQRPLPGLVPIHAGQDQMKHDIIQYCKPGDEVEMLEDKPHLAPELLKFGPC